MRCTEENSNFLVRQSCTNSYGCHLGIALIWLAERFSRDGKQPAASYVLVPPILAQWLAFVVNLLPDTLSISPANVLLSWLCMSIRYPGSFDYLWLKHAIYTGSLLT